MIGTAVGAVVGGLAGKGVAEAIDPTDEEVFWRENFKTCPYADGKSFDDYGPAFMYGVNSYSKYPRTRFDDVDSTGIFSRRVFLCSKLRVDERGEPFREFLLPGSGGPFGKGDLP